MHEKCRICAKCRICFPEFEPITTPAKYTGPVPEKYMNYDGIDDWPEIELWRAARWRFTKKLNSEPSNKCPFCARCECDECLWRKRMGHCDIDDGSFWKRWKNGDDDTHEAMLGEIDAVIEELEEKPEEKPEKEPELVKCRDCQHARDIRAGEKSIPYFCNCGIGRYVGKVDLNYDRECPSFVEKTCEGCRFSVGFTCSMTDEPLCGEHGMGLHKWEPIPEKEPEKEKNWKWQRACGDCVFLEQAAPKGNNGHWICPKGNRVVRCPEETHKVHFHPKGKCSDYKKKEPEWAWEAPNKCDGCKFWTDNGRVVPNGDNDPRLWMKCGRDWLIRGYERPHGSKGKQCYDYEKPWEWEADCGDCIHQHNTTKKFDMLWCGHPTRSHIIKSNYNGIGSYWHYRQENPNFHDCEGYTAPEKTMDEKTKPTILKCDTCTHYPGDDGDTMKICLMACDTENSAYIPRTHDNCGHQQLDGMCYQDCDVFKKDKWVPRSCENCGDTGEPDSGCMHCKCGNDFLNWIPKPAEPVKSCENCENMTGSRCDVSDGLVCGNGMKDIDGTTGERWRSWTPKVGKEIPVKTKINKQEEVTEMNEQDEKTKEKLGKSCPECESDEFIPGHAAYCPFCGHEFGKKRVLLDNQDQWIQDALHIPDKREKTRKAVRVRGDKSIKGHAIGLGIMMCIVIVCVIIRFEITMFVGCFWTVIYTGRILHRLELVDVPRVPVMDRIKAWRQARKDTRIAKLEESVRRGEDAIGHMDDGIKQLESIIENRNAKIEELKRTAANLTKLHEEEKNTLIKGRESQERAFMDKYDAILADRDENWIPLSNRIYAKIKGIKTVDTSSAFFNKIPCFIEEEIGKSTNTVSNHVIRGKISDIVLFSKDALPEKNKDGED